MELSKEDEKKEFDKILEGFIPAHNYVLVAAENSKYQSQNGVISNLQKGGSAAEGTIFRLGVIDASTKRKPEIGQTILFMKYDGVEVVQGIYLLETSKIKMYKNEQ